MQNSNCRGQLAERDCEPKAARLVGGDLVVAAARVLPERMTRGEHPKPGHFLIARIGHSRRFSCAWSASTRELAAAVADDDPQAVSFERLDLDAGDEADRAATDQSFDDRAEPSPLGHRRRPRRHTA
jgi:hypothetical protein